MSKRWSIYTLQKLFHGDRKMPVVWVDSAYFLSSCNTTDFSRTLQLISMSEIDGELLISLIEMKPILWDKEWGTRKDRKAMKLAWYEVCAGLRDNFEDIHELEQTSFMKEVIRRWTNIRDTFAKSIKIRRSKTGSKKHRKYIYHDQLHFLHKYYEFENKVEIAKHATKKRNAGSPIKTTDATYTKTTDTSSSRTTRNSEKKSKTEETISSKDVTKQNPDWRLSFFNSVLPNIEKFDEHEILMFQMGVLQLIFDIKEQRKTKTNSPLFSSSSSRQRASTITINSRTMSEEIAPIRNNEEITPIRNSSRQQASTITIKSRTISEEIAPIRNNEEITPIRNLSRRVPRNLFRGAIEDSH